MNGRTLVLSASVCAVLLFACSGKIDPNATGDGPGGASSGGSTSGAGASGGTGDTANGSVGDGSGPSTGTDPDGPVSSAPCFVIKTGCSGKEAFGVCQSKGYVVSSLTKSSGGGCEVTCCPSKAPPPPPPPTRCIYEQIGDGATCLSHADIKAQAVSLCDLQKMSVRSLYPANDCPGGSTIAKLECCAGK